MKTELNHGTHRQGHGHHRRYLSAGRFVTILLLLTATGIVSCDTQRRVVAEHESRTPVGELVFYVTEGYDWAAVDIKVDLRREFGYADPNLHYVKEQIVRLEEGLGEEGDGGMGGFVMNVPLGRYKIETLEVRELTRGRKPIRYELGGVSSGYHVDVMNEESVIVPIRLLSNSSD